VPSMESGRQDTRELREKILGMSQSEARRAGNRKEHPPLFAGEGCQARLVQGLQ